jgi:hypothetical protein
MPHGRHGVNYLKDVVKIVFKDVQDKKTIQYNVAY